MTEEKTSTFETDKKRFGFLDAVRMNCREISREVLKTFSVPELLNILRNVSRSDYETLNKNVFLTYLEKSKERSIAEIGKDYSEVMYWLPLSVPEHSGFCGDNVFLQTLEERCVDDKEKWKEAFEAFPAPSYLSRQIMRKLHSL